MKDAASGLASLHALVHGQVQGVFCRAFVQNHARGLGLTGYVRNVQQPAAVEVEAEGERAALTRLLEHLHEGPTEARVVRVEIEWGDYRGSFADFRISH